MASSYPNEQIHQGVTSIKELEGIVSIGENHPWLHSKLN